MFDFADNARIHGTLARPASVGVYLLGQIEFRRCQELQRQLVYDAWCRADGQISLLVCEHPAVVTIGRSGSPRDIDLRGVQLAGRTLDVIEVQRGGGTLLHVPGQLAIYPIVPLEWHGWTVGEYLARLETGLIDALAELRIEGARRPGRQGVWGASGQLAWLGVSVKQWIAYHGAFLQVVPPLRLLNYITTDPVDATAAGSLYAELGRAVRMSNVRSRIGRSIAEAFGCDKYQLYTDHPLLSQIGRMPLDPALAS